MLSALAAASSRSSVQAPVERYFHPASQTTNTTVAVSPSGTCSATRTAPARAAPVDRPAIYLGKLVGLLLLLAVVETVVVVLVAFLFGAPFFRHGWWLLALLSLGTLGFASVGTLFAAMLVRTRSRAVLLPVLLYPVTIPVLIMGVSGTAALVQAEPDLAMAQLWVSVLFFFDTVFLVLALWTFEPVMTE